MEKKFLTIREAAELISFSVPAIKKMIAAGKIPCYKVGGKRLFDRDELIEWVKSKRDQRFKG